MLYRKYYNVANVIIININKKCLTNLQIKMLPNHDQYSKKDSFSVMVGCKMPPLHGNGS